MNTNLKAECAILEFICNGTSHTGEKERSKMSMENSDRESAQKSGVEYDDTLLHEYMQF